MNPKIFALVLLLLLAVISDAKTFKIRNPIPLGFILAGVGINLYEKGPYGITGVLQAVILPVLLLFPLFALRMLGAGDIKLFSSIGAIMGTGFTFGAMVSSFLWGGVFALGIMAVRKNGVQRMLYFLSYIKNCLQVGSFLPYTDFADKADGAKLRLSYAIAFGTMFYCVFGPFIFALGSI